MSEHTKEPWHLETSEGIHRICGSKQHPAVGVPTVAFECVYGRGIGHQDHIDECAANAHRIVAAVNACAGIPTEALEADVVRRMQALLSRIGSHGLYEDPDGNGLSKTDKRAGKLAFEIRAILAEITDA